MKRQFKLIVNKQIVKINSHRVTNHRVDNSLVDKDGKLKELKTLYGCNLYLGVL